MGKNREKTDDFAPNPLVESGVGKMIQVIRGKQVLLDRDLATLYEVETKYINRAELIAKLTKPAVPQIPGCHLDAYTVSRSIFPCVEIHTMHPHAIGISPGLDQSLIPIAFRATKMEVAMRNGKRIRTQFIQEQISHAHRVHPPADRKEKRG